MPTDFEIGKAATLVPIQEIASRLGLQDDEVIPYGRHKAKVHYRTLNRIASRPLGKYVVVTAINPTPLGEGKTVTTIGSSLGLAKLGAKVVTCLRQPSMGPLFGIKGGAAGGGYSQVLPMEEYNLHLTGDIHAVTAAHNLLAALVDASLFHGNPLKLKPDAITWPRVLDLNDRALRHVRVGLGTEKDGRPRDSRFDIAVASEIMAILALATSFKDLRARLGRIIVGPNEAGRPVTAEDLQGAGAMGAILRDTMFPTLMQTIEHTPVFIHAGPFANIAHGNSSVVADQIGLRLADFVVTEAGFGSDCGFEKFAHIKCGVSGLKPDAAVLVCTVRALKMHGGAFNIAPGHPLPQEEVAKENMEALSKGIQNLEKHIENVRLFGVPVVVAINHFPTDSEKEEKLIAERAKAAGAFDVVVSEVFAKGGDGGRALAEAVRRACQQPHAFTPVVSPEQTVREKIQTLATKIYGAAGVDFAPEAETALAALDAGGFGRLPVCVAKTPLSLSHDPLLKGRPSGFRFPIREIRLAAGAGFVVALAGAVQTMPGLPKIPGASRVELQDDGTITGLF